MNLTVHFAPRTNESEREGQLLPSHIVVMQDPTPTRIQVLH